MKRMFWILLGVWAVLLVAMYARSQTITHSVTLTWQWSGTGTPTYNVYRATTKGAEAKPALASGLANTTYQDTTPVLGTTYYYTVTATVGGVESAASPEVSAQIVPPNAPTNPATAVQ